MASFQAWVSLVARVFLSAVFIRAGVTKILNPAGTQAYMAKFGVPGWLLVPTIVVLLVGGISVLVGYRARWGAALLIGFLIPATLIFHTDFRQNLEVIQFFKNLALMGGLLLVVAYGSGPLSVERPRQTF
ncbi:MAG: DoxX family protein [Gloeomargarita sp. SKYBB_i_bin120]|nr:DoxX family protein [Gloeomargarita sp. SKYG98]MCS7293489.1 DoxX family protein [Gloeomargarita sp. SKYB120]MDW8179055.1 DoxX family protein [Gloeomargarita sp. SKYBB_i_bin120]